jgi:predicted RNase H-like HicB family nuclease
MNQKIDKYEIIIYWSDQDGAYIADVPELPGCCAHGETREDALRNAEMAAVLWIETAEEYGDNIPEPKGRRLLFA